MNIMTLGAKLKRQPITS